jgi:hypothetical protein
MKKGNCKATVYAELLLVGIIGRSLKFKYLIDGKTPTDNTPAILEVLIDEEEFKRFDGAPVKKINPLGISCNVILLTIYQKINSFYLNIY